MLPVVETVRCSECGGILFACYRNRGLPELWVDECMICRDDSFRNGCDVGYQDGHSSGYHDGVHDGYAEGQDEGYRDGYNDGQQEGHEDGLRAGRREGEMNAQYRSYR